VIWGLLVVSTVDQLIQNKVISVKAGMHPAIALVGVIDGVVAFGVLGVLLGPIVIALFLTVVGIYLGSGMRR